MTDLWRYIAAIRLLGTDEPETLRRSLQWSSARADKARMSWLRLGEEQ